MKENAKKELRCKKVENKILKKNNRNGSLPCSCIKLA